jgi:hypothetical protein
MLSDSLGGKLAKWEHGSLEGEEGGEGEESKEGEASNQERIWVRYSYRGALSLLSQIAFTGLRVDARKVHGDETEEKDTSSQKHDQE